MNPLFPYMMEEIKSTLIWRTYVGQTYSNEWRESLYAYPCLKMDITVALFNDDNSHLVSFLTADPENIRVPDWRVCQSGVYNAGVDWPTDYRDVTVGSPVMVFDGQNIMETTVLSMTPTRVVFADDYVGRTLFFAPIRTMKLVSDVSFSQRTGIFSTASFSLLLDEYRGFGAGTTPTLLGSPIRTVPLLVDHSAQSVTMNRDTSFSDAGVISLTKNRIFDQSYGAYGFLVDTARKFIDEEKLLIAFEGRSVPFWNPTWQKDFFPKFTHSPADSELVTLARKTETADRLHAIVIRSHGVLSYHIVRQVIGGPTETRLLLVNPLGITIDPADPTLTISKLEFVRFDSDEIACNISGNGYKCSVATVEVFR